MKIMPFIRNFEQKHANATLFIGIAIGIGVGMYLFAFLVPGSTQLVRMYNMERFEHGSRSGSMMMHNGSMTIMQMSGSAITNENQFLTEMIAHHEAAVRMSHQLLSLTGVSEKVAKLAQDIIDSQSAEIATMKGWLSGNK